jgi:hypothetical protein
MGYISYGKQNKSKQKYKLAYSKFNKVFRRSYAPKRRITLRKRKRYSKYKLKGGVPRNSTAPVYNRNQSTGSMDWQPTRVRAPSNGSNTSGVRYNPMAAARKIQKKYKAFAQTKKHKAANTITNAFKRLREKKLRNRQPKTRVGNATRTTRVQSTPSRGPHRQNVKFNRRIIKRQKRKQTLKRRIRVARTAAEQKSEAAERTAMANEDTRSAARAAATPEPTEENYSHKRMRYTKETDRPQAEQERKKRDFKELDTPVTTRNPRFRGTSGDEEL